MGITDDASKEGGARVGKGLWIPGLCLIALLVVASACGQPAPEASTATPVPATEPPTAAEVVPTEDPAPTEEPTTVPARPTPTAAATEPPPTEPPTATPEPTATVEPDTPTAPPTEDPDPTAAPVEEGAVLLERRCTVCHTLDRVESSQKSREEWESTVARMVEYGAELTDEERAVLIDYLTVTYGG
jgi:hypothetical protein